MRSSNTGRSRKYNAIVKRQPIGIRFREGIRKEDKAGCGIPLCTIVDMKIKTFKSMCDLVEWMEDSGKYRTVMEIQKGACENASKN